MTTHRAAAAALILTVTLPLGAGCASDPPPAQPAAEPTEVDRSILREEAIELLTAAAASESAQLRANAIEAFRLAPARAADVVRAGLVDENLGVRYVAAMTAGELGDRSLLPAVRPLLEDESRSVRAAAVYAARTLGGDADPSMLASMLLSDPDPRRRAQAAYILGELGESSAIPLLRDAARRDPSTATLAELRLLRLQIAEAMAKLGDDEAIETLRAALYPSRPEELEAAALAAQILGEVGDRRSVDQLIYLIEREGVDAMPAEVRLAAAGALAKLGERGGGFIADAYDDDENPLLRAQAAAVHGLVGGSDRLPSVRRLMDDPDPQVQVAAAAAALRLTR
jgi:HEAT repeat protein